MPQYTYKADDYVIVISQHGAYWQGQVFILSNIVHTSEKMLERSEVVEDLVRFTGVSYSYWHEIVKGNGEGAL